jgi:1,4-dihydroxy-2-naphthoate octaprenyltransferase
MIYVVIAYLVFVPHYFTPVLLITFIAIKDAWRVIKVLNAPKPTQAPEGWPGWPVWFAGFAFLHNRNFGGLLILSLIIDALLRVFLPSFWPVL